MNQAERDRLDALKRAKKKLITQQQAAQEIGVTERQVRRLLRKLRQKGDRAVIHELRGRRSILDQPRVPAEHLCRGWKLGSEHGSLDCRYAAISAGLAGRASNWTG